MGQDALGEALDVAARHKQVLGHPVVVRRVTRMYALEIRHLAYVRSAPGRPVTAALRVLVKPPVPTVADEGAETPSVILRFVLAGGRVKFLVDTAAAQAVGLTISSKLLSLAVSTRGVDS